MDVYLRDDPGQKGILTGRERDRAGTKMYLVKWSDNTSSWKPEYELVFVEDAEDVADVFALLDNKRFGRLNDLRRNLTFIQLSGRLANVVYSMDTTNTDFYAYQYKPVLTFLESPSSGILIADEVGLGKTIEAGLIWTELRARFDARRLLVVCPAMLREKWCDELSNRFGVEGVQMSADELRKELQKDKHSVPDGKGYVCSLQGLRPPRNWKKVDEANSGSALLARFLEDLTEEEPAIDLLIIDEAHYLRNPDTQSAVLGRLLRDVSDAVVLLSATPVNNQERDLFQLLKLVDPDTFSVEHVFPQVLSANEPLVKARNLALNPNSKAEEIKKFLHQAQEHSLLSENKQLKGLIDRNFGNDYLEEKANRVDLANRIERINLLRHTVNRTRKIEVQELKVVRESFSQFVKLDPDGPEWDFYIRVTSAIRLYALGRDINDGFLLASPQKQISSCMYAAAKSWMDRAGIQDIKELAYEDFGADSDDFGDCSPLIKHIAETVLPYVDVKELRKNDSKFDAFSNVVTGHFKSFPDEKIIVFSFFKGTLHYLAERLSELGITSQLLHGSIGETKQDVIDRFRNDMTSRVLLTSEVASEGVDLQFCRILINYDIPWNPMRIEQRIGRIDRIGQMAEKISIWNLCYANTIDERIYSKLLVKLGIFERALGGMEAILGDMISNLTSDLLSRPLTNEQEEDRINNAYIAVENIRQQQEELEANAAHLIAHGGYILEKVNAAHEFKRRITDIDLKIYVKDYLDRYCHGYQFTEKGVDPMRVDIKLPAETSAKLDEFIKDHKLFGLTRLATGDKVDCKFVNKIKGRGDRFESINQFHPFVRFISSELKQFDQAYYPLVAMSLVNVHLPHVGKGIYAFVVKRWSFSGLKTDEEIHARVLPVDNEFTEKTMDTDSSWEFINAARVEGDDWLSVSNEVDTHHLSNLFDKCDVQLERDYSIVKEDYINENSDRVNFQIQSATKHRDRLLMTQEELLSRYRQQGKSRLIPMTQGRIDKIKHKFEVQFEKLKIKSSIKASSSDVAYGVIKVI